MEIHMNQRGTSDWNLRLRNHNKAACLFGSKLCRWHWDLSSCMWGSWLLGSLWSAWIAGYLGFYVNINVDAVFILDFMLCLSFWNCNSRLIRHLPPKCDRGRRELYDCAADDSRFAEALVFKPFFGFCQCLGRCATQHFLATFCAETRLCICRFVISWMIVWG